MTPSRLSELKELAEKATVGPWEPILNEGGEEYWLPHPFWTTTACGPCGEPNARFIAAARTAVPELVAEVERLTAHVDELSEKITAPNCACSYDRPGDICMAHSPALRRAMEAIADIQAKAEVMMHGDQGGSCVNYIVDRCKRARAALGGQP